MPKLTFPTKALLIASVCVLVPSCGDKVRPVPLPPAPAEIADNQANDTRPLYPADGIFSEEKHEGWEDDALDWGDRRNLLAYRWCQLWNKYASVKIDCGPAPEGVTVPSGSEQT